MSIQTVRWALYLLSGLVLLALAVGTLVRAHRRGKARPRWPLQWQALSGLFLFSVAGVQLVDALRVYERWPLRHEYRLSAASLVFCSVMSVWMFGRWWKDGEQE